MKYFFWVNWRISVNKWVKNNFCDIKKKWEEKIARNFVLFFLQFSQKILFVELGQIVNFFEIVQRNFLSKGKILSKFTKSVTQNFLFSKITKKFLLKISCFQKWKINFFKWEIVGVDERKQVKILSVFFQKMNFFVNRKNYRKRFLGFSPIFSKNPVCWIWSHRDFVLKSPNEIFCQKGKFYPNWQKFLLKISCFQKWKIHFFIWEIVGTNERKQVKIVCDFLVQPDPTQNIEHINFSNPKREEKNMKWQREKLLIRTHHEETVRVISKIFQIW